MQRVPLPPRSSIGTHRYYGLARWHNGLHGIMGHYKAPRPPSPVTGSKYSGSYTITKFFAKLIFTFQNGAKKVFVKCFDFFYI